MFRIKLKQLREEKGLSQQAFADTFGVGQSTIGGWESGKREPSIDTMKKLADFFNISIDDLLGRELNAEKANFEINELKIIPSFNTQLKLLRENIGLSQYDFAEKIGVPQSTLGGWESGTREPNWTMIWKLADFFNVSINYLLGKEEQKEKLAAYNDEREKEISELDSIVDAMTDEQVHFYKEMLNLALTPGADLDKIVKMVRLLVSEKQPD